MALIMLGLLPLGALALLAFLARPHATDWREAILRAAIVWGWIAWAIAEGLGLIGALGFPALTALWSLAAIGSAILVWRQGGTRPETTPPQPPGPDRASAWLIAGAVSIASVTGAIGLISAPTTWDSMSYHLARVEHWVQNASLAFYPTHILRQIEFYPFAETLILHFRLLTGGDMLASLAQWLAMAGSLVAVSSIAQRLGADRLARALGVLFAATAPMGIIQSSGTQNDYVVAFFIAVFIERFLAWRESERWHLALEAGAALALAMLTKPTAYIFALPFCLWFAAEMFLRQGWRGWRVAAAVSALAVAPSLVFLSRAVATFGVPWWSPVGGWIVNEAFGPRILLSNVLRHGGLHLSTPSDAVNAVTLWGIRHLHDIIGIDPSHASISYEGRDFLLDATVFHEHNAANPAHALVLVLGLALLLIPAIRRAKPVPAIYALCLVAGGLMLLTLLKWSPWNTRYHVPVFVLAAPFLAAMATPRLGRPAALALGVFLFLAAQPWIWLNHTRPIVTSERAAQKLSMLPGVAIVLSSPSIFATTRVERMFAIRPYLRESFELATDYIAREGHNRIGFISREEAWEYPLWILLRQKLRGDFRLEHVAVKNFSRSATYPLGPFAPSVIVVTEMGEQPWPAEALRDFALVKEFPDLSVHVRMVSPTAPSR